MAFHGDIERINIFVFYLGEMREDHRKFDGSNHLAFLIFSKRVGFKFPQHKKKVRVR